MCTCNGQTCVIGGCGVDCAADTPVCGGNSVSWTSITPGIVITAAHIVELQNAINSERTNAPRRITGGGCPSNCNDAYSFPRVPAASTDTILANDLNEVTDANNGAAYHQPVGYQASVGVAINAADVVALQDAIWDGPGTPSTRYNCICDGYNCGDCTCNGECPCDSKAY